MSKQTWQQGIEAALAESYAAVGYPNPGSAILNYKIPDFTPGPWLAQGPYGKAPNAYFTVKHKSENVDGADHCDIPIPQPTQQSFDRAQANSRLIAASPSLYTVTFLLEALSRKTLSVSAFQVEFGRIAGMAHAALLLVDPKTPPR